MWTSLNIAICGTAIDRMALSPSALQQCGRDADDPYMIAIQQSTDYLSIRDSIYLVNRPLPSILGLVERRRVALDVGDLQGVDEPGGGEAAHRQRS